MQFYFVRHGKTEWNLARRFQGAHGDSPLLPQSLVDIAKLGVHLKNTDFRTIYSSPLRRARET
ncbi:histidine phosphatase family protein, partial [Lactobacillus sp. XV13L]|nr:histidine phosphatase family protein [Lactobacillus sp. XV13L]